MVKTNKAGEILLYLFWFCWWFYSEAEPFLLTS